MHHTLTLLASCTHVIRENTCHQFRPYKDFEMVPTSCLSLSVNRWGSITKFSWWNSCCSVLSRSMGHSRIDQWTTRGTLGTETGGRRRRSRQTSSLWPCTVSPKLCWEFLEEGDRATDRADTLQAGFHLYSTYENLPL